MPDILSNPFRSTPGHSKKEVAQLAKVLLGEDMETEENTTASDALKMPENFDNLSASKEEKEALKDKPWTREQLIEWAERYGKDEHWIDETFTKNPNGTWEVEGDLNASFLTDPTDFPKGIDSIGGVLILDSLVSAEGLKFPNSIGGDLILHSLTSAKGLKLPDSIGGTLYLSGLTSAEGLEIPASFKGLLFVIAPFGELDQLKARYPDINIQVAVDTTQ